MMNRNNTQVPSISYSTSTLISANEISKSYGQTSILKSINLNINSGEFVCIMGPSGSGKSTLLHILSSLDSPDSGTVKLAGQNPHLMSDHKLAEFRRLHIGFVFQFFNLLPHLTALENIATPALLNNQSLKESQPRALELLKLVNLNDRGHHKPSQLSGGQMQRVAIARALYSKPYLLMADEPTGNLDSKAGTEILEILKRLNAAGQTIVMVTHDQKLSQLAKRIITLKDGMIESDIYHKNNSTDIMENK